MKQYLVTTYNMGLDSNNQFNTGWLNSQFQLNSVFLTKLYIGYYDCF